jgi:hypothetical protein
MLWGGKAGVSCCSCIGERVGLTSLLPRTTQRLISLLVCGAEASYARKLGVTHRPPARDNAPAIAALRNDIVTALRAPSDGRARVPTGWPPRYAARRIA